MVSVSEYLCLLFGLFVWVVEALRYSQQVFSDVGADLLFVAISVVL